MARLPVSGSDNGTWGEILNEFLSVSLNSDGTLQTTAVDSAVSEASASTKGVIQLAGDLGGTAASPTVPGLASKANDNTVVHLTGNESIDGVKTFTSAPVVPSNSFAESAVTNLVSDLAAKQSTSAKGQANGYASLGSDSKVPLAQLPDLLPPAGVTMSSAAAVATNTVGTLRFGTGNYMNPSLPSWISISNFNLVFSQQGIYSVTAHITVAPSNATAAGIYSADDKQYIELGATTANPVARTFFIYVLDGGWTTFLSGLSSSFRVAVLLATTNTELGLRFRTIYTGGGTTGTLTNGAPYMIINKVA